ncbi:hypothetical protein ACG907_02380 [Acinetobacter bereziniae]|uniref:hypothetical protein n=1 Tax=Acinetobacter bereziniae TaxID=106648 RepID=UPI003AF71399
MKKILLIIIISQSLLACASLSTQRYETHNDLMQSWVGSSEEKLIKKWGLPDKSYTLTNGGKIISYETFVHPGRYCEEKFMLENGIIVKWGHSRCDLNLNNAKKISKDIPIPQPTL